jgi:ribosomal protein S2
MINKQLKKKENQQNILLNSLFKSKNFYGEILNKTNKNIVPFIYGIRHNYAIINLKYTSFFLKRIFKLIQYTIKKKKKILIIGNSDDIKFLINKNFTKNNSNIIFYNKEWINGLITNKLINNIQNQSLKDIRLVIIVKSSINQKYLIQELSTLRIPIISFINTDCEIKNIQYPVLMNTHNIQSLYTVMYWLRKLF